MANSDSKHVQRKRNKENLQAHNAGKIDERIAEGGTIDKQYKATAEAYSKTAMLNTIRASVSNPGSTWLAPPYSMVSNLSQPQDRGSTSSLTPLARGFTRSFSSLDFSGIRGIMKNSYLMPLDMYTSPIGTQNADTIGRSDLDQIKRNDIFLSTHASPLPSMSSRRPSDWRSSLSIPRKSSHPPSVTVVFAEPERSPPSASAVAKLSRKMSMQSIESKKRDRNGDIETNLHSDVGSVSEERTDGTNEHTDKRQRVDEEAQAPVTEGQLAETGLKQRTASWFSLRGQSSRQSLGTKNGLLPAPSEALVTRGVDEQPETSTQAINEVPPTSAPIPIDDRHELERGLNPSQSPSVSWFGSLSKRQRSARSEEPQISDHSGREQKDLSTNTAKSIWFTPQSPPSYREAKTPSGPSSLGEQEPSGANSPPLVKAMPELVSTQTSEIRLSALNPSSSRFTLSMPLLGRPKMPLEKALMKTEGQHVEQGLPYPVFGAPSEPDPSVPGDSLTALGAEVSTIDPPPAVACLAEPSSEPNVQSAPESKQASWLEYIGFGSAKSSATSLPIQDSSGVSSPPGVDSTPPTSDPSPPPQNKPASEQEAIDTEVAEDSSHLLTSGQTLASTWYSPWGWYEWYRGPGEPSFETTLNAKTEAELVKEEALARPEADEPQSDVEDTADLLPKSPTEDSVNPIASSVSDNTRGWMSFFSVSRALTVKSVSEREEDGMEVMLIEETDNAENAENALSRDKDNKDGNSVKKAQSVRNIENALEIPKDTALAPPLTSSNGIKRAVAETTKTKRGSSPTPSKKSIPPPTPKLPNLVLPTFDDTFNTLPRSRPPPTESTTSAIRKTFGYVSNMLFARDHDGRTGEGKGKGRVRHSDIHHFGNELPRAWSVLGSLPETQMLASCKKVVVIGVHGWFPGLAVRTVLGEPTGTSSKFANMMASAVDAFAEKHGVKFEQVTKIPLEGEGKIDHRVQKLYRNLTSRDDWMEALHGADVIFVATHSQGSIVSTHLISQLITDGHLRTRHNTDVVASLSSTTLSGGVAAVSGMKNQHICCLAMCGIHLGPLAYLQKSSLVMPYIQYFESEAAAELFEFQNTGSNVSNSYVKAVQHVLDNGVKMVYIASLNDQVVPIYSGVFTCLSHPLVLRSLYIDGDAYHSSDFLSNLLILLLRIRNAGLSDGGLLTHLSEATAGSLSGVGHSTVYEEPATYSLAVDYLFLVNDGQFSPVDTDFEPFNARDALNDYDIPWNLRDLLADERVVYLFSKEFTELRDAFSDWHPRTTILRDLKRKLEPIRRLKLTSRL